jgi:hypothetical protein
MQIRMTRRAKRDLILWHQRCFAMCASGVDVMAVKS